MLKYLITGTETLIASAVMLGMLFAYIRTVYDGRGRKILTVGSLLGLAAAIVMAYLKNKTKLIMGLFRRHNCPPLEFIPLFSRCIWQRYGRTIFA